MFLYGALYYVQLLRVSLFLYRFYLLYIILLHYVLASCAYITWLYYIIIFTLHELLILVGQRLGRSPVSMTCLEPMVYRLMGSQHMNCFTFGDHKLIQVSGNKSRVFYICRSYNNWAMTLLNGNYRRPFNKPSSWLLKQQVRCVIPSQDLNAYIHTFWTISWTNAFVARR